ncbi:UNVERIFIED_CONTAM: hypothetical protein NCL1_45992 [Trichonephila clavipes]
MLNLWELDCLGPGLKNRLIAQKDKLIHTTKKTCSFKHEEMSCSNPVLPYTWHCKKRILSFFPCSSDFEF